MTSDFRPNQAQLATLNRETAAIALLGLVLFIAGIWNQPFIGFESRFALFAQEMLRHGPSAFPTTYGEPYPDYPATATLMIWLLSLPFSAVTKLAAVLPTALFTSATLALSYRLVALHSRRWAALTVCFELLTATFLAEARSLSLDQMVATLTLAAFYVVYSADVLRDPRRRYWLPLVLLCGFAIRGPLGLVLPTGVVCSYYALSGQWRQLLRSGSLALLLLIAAWAALLGLAAQAGGRAFVDAVIRMQVAGRISAGEALGPAYYFTSGFGNYALAYPLAVLVIAAVAHRYRERQRDSQLALLFFAMGWIAVIMLGLSIPHTKKTRYLLPIVPALAILAAYPLAAAGGDRLLALLRKLTRALLLALPALALIALWAGERHLARKGLAVQLPLLWAMIGLGLCQLATLAAQWRGIAPARRDLYSAALAALALWLAQVLVVEPAQLQLHDTRGFVRAAEALRRGQPAPLALYDMGRDAEAIKYLVNVDADLQPLFYARPAQLAEAPRPLYVMVQSKQAAPLQDAAAPAQVVLQARFDNKNYTLLYLPPR